jgi:hypothetical protein
LEVQLAALVLLVMQPDLICIHVHLVLAHTVSELHRIRVTELLSPNCHDTEAFVLEGGEEGAEKEVADELGSGWGHVR